MLPSDCRRLAQAPARIAPPKLQPIVFDRGIVPTGGRRESTVAYGSQPGALREEITLIRYRDREDQ
jgi:hypothetical protein